MFGVTLAPLTVLCADRTGGSFIIVQREDSRDV